VRFATRIEIRARPDAIWQVLTDLAAYPGWNATVDKVEGEIALCRKVTIHAKIAPGNAFPVRATALEPLRKMVWTGGAPLKFMFKGERTFLLTAKGPDAVEFSMEEVFDGLLAKISASPYRISNPLSMSSRRASSAASKRERSQGSLERAILSS
jgi:hypothetical protein